MNIDTSWKKVSRTTLTLAGTTLYPINSVDDLSICQVSVAIAGSGNTVTVCQFYVEYDVEFKNPVGLGGNA